MKNLQQLSKQELIEEVKNLRKTAGIASGQVKNIVITHEDISERKQSEVALRQNHARHDAMLTHISDVIGIVGADGTIKYQSPNIEKWFGWKPEDLIGASGWDKIHPEDIERVKLGFNKLLETNEKQTVEYRFKCKDGSYRWIELTAVNRIEEPAINGVLVNYRDISERKDADKLIKASESRLSIAQEIGLIGTWNLDISNNILEWTEQNYKIFGVNPGTPMSLSDFFEIIHPDDRDYVNEKWTAGTKGDNYDIEHRLLVNGKVKWVREKAEVTFDKNGKATSAVGIAQDITEKKKSEEKLKESEVRLHKVLNTSPFPISVVDVNDDVIHYWSQSAITMFGHNPSTAGEWYELAYPDPAYRQEVIERWKPLLKEAEQSKTAVNTGEYNIVCKDGSTKICEIFAQFIPGNLIVTMHDVTEPKKAKIALQESKAFNETLLQSSPDVIYIYDIVEHNNVYSNNGITKILGYSIEEIQEMGDQLLELLMHPDDFKTYLNEVYPRYHQLKDNELVSHEYRMKHKNGKWYWLLSKESVFLRETVGKPVQIFGMISDITKRKQAAKALEESEEKLNSIINTSPIGICTVDMLGNFITTNQAYERILGYTKEELVGLSFFDVTHQNDRPKNKRLFQDMFSLDTEGFFMEKRYIRKDGEEIKVSVHAIGISDAEGNIMYGTAFVDDITERKQAEEELTKYRGHLEDLVKERTQELETINKELERINNLFVDREFRIKELREKVKELENKNGQLKNLK